MTLNCLTAQCNTVEFVIILLISQLRMKGHSLSSCNGVLTKSNPAVIVFQLLLFLVTSMPTTILATLHLQIPILELSCLIS